MIFTFNNKRKCNLFYTDFEPNDKLPIFVYIKLSLSNMDAYSSKCNSQLSVQFYLIGSLRIIHVLRISKSSADGSGYVEYYFNIF